MEKGSNDNIGDKTATQRAREGGGVKTDPNKEETQERENTYSGVCMFLFSLETKQNG